MDGVVGPEFASCWLKIGRAEEHLQAFEAEVSEWSHGDPYVIFRKCNADGSRHSLIVADLRTAPPLDRWSLIAGDCIHNLRSALDNLVYALAVRDTGKIRPANFTRLQFPIADTAAKYQVAIQRNCLAGLSSAAQTRIEAAQPYKRPHTELPPLLGMLRDFDGANKHRLLSTAFQQVAGGKFSFRRPLVGTANVFYRLMPIERGTEFAFFTIDPPQPDVDYKYEVSFAISIGHSLGPSGRAWSELGPLLKLLAAEVTGIVNTAIL